MYAQISIEEDLYTTSMKINEFSGNFQLIQKDKEFDLM
jgi:hypothetical protein